MIRMEMKTEILPAKGEGIAKAAALLQRGELVALPTETVYGIAADARIGEAVAKIFVAKGRPQDNPLICLLYTSPGTPEFGAAEPARMMRPSLWPRLVSTTTSTSCPAVKPGPRAMVSGAISRVVPRFFFEMCIRDRSRRRSRSLPYRSGRRRW